MLIFLLLILAMDIDEKSSVSSKQENETEDLACRLEILTFERCFVLWSSFFALFGIYEFADVFTCTGIRLRRCFVVSILHT